MKATYATSPPGAAASRAGANSARWQGAQRLDVGRVTPPARLGPAPERAQTGAGDVGQDPGCGCPGATTGGLRRPRPRRGAGRGGSPRVALAATRAARCGASSPATTRLPSGTASPVSSAVLPPGPAERSSHQPGAAGGRVTPQATSWEPSSCTPARPVRTSGRSAGCRCRGRRRGPPARLGARLGRESATLARPGRTTSETSGLTLSAASAGTSSPSGSRSAYASTTQRGCACARARRSQRVAVRAEPGDPPARSCAATRPQHGVHQAGRASPDGGAGEVDGLAHRGVGADPHAQTWCAPSRRRSTTAGCSVPRARRPEAASRTAS